MYARPELASAHQHFWQLIRAELQQCGVNAPEYLSEHTNLESVWLDRELLLSQTCGMPYRLRLSDKVALIGTPDYAVADCAPGFYRSAVIVRANDSRQNPGDYAGARFAYNQRDSQSGFAAAYQYCQAKGFWFSRVVETGAHAASAQAVISEQADIATIDAVTWELLKRYESMEALRVLDWTDAAPGLPYITSLSMDANLLFDAISVAISNLPADDKTRLMIRGIVKISANDYLAVPNPDI